MRTGSLTVSVKVSGFSDVRVDESVWIRLHAEALNFYDSGTEKLIG
jgi:hypothetical protein